MNAIISGRVTDLFLCNPAEIAPKAVSGIAPTIVNTIALTIANRIAPTIVRWIALSARGAIAPTGVARSYRVVTGAPSNAFISTLFTSSMIFANTWADCSSPAAGTALSVSMSV